MGKIVLEVKNLTKIYESGDTRVHALDNVSFSVEEGETIGIVGESGCGKTTLGRCIARGIEATSGQVILHRKNEDVDFLKVSKEKMREIRPEVQMIFQDPYGSLDPRMTVFDIISEPLRYFGRLSHEEINRRVSDIAEKVGLDKSYLRRYPHAFSGGQRQRIGIARSLILNPKVIVCDEAVSALDVSIQAQIINLLEDIKKEYGITFLFISHALSVVHHISDKVLVMYLGKIVEYGNTEDIFKNPMHPYTQALLSATPMPDPDYKVDRIILKGEVPSPANPPKGCHFNPRCLYKTELCENKYPPLEQIDGRYVACWKCNKCEGRK